MITVLTREELQKRLGSMCRPYKYLGEGYAWESKQSLGNFLFFHKMRLKEIKNTTFTKNKILLLNESIPQVQLMGWEEYSTYSEYNEYITLQNGDYVIQREVGGKFISLFSGEHKKHKLIINYGKAEKILNRVSFSKIHKNTIKPKENEIVIIQFKGGGPIMKTTLTIEEIDLTIEEKKEAIISFKGYRNNIVMYNHGIFFVVPASKKS